MLQHPCAHAEGPGIRIKLLLLKVEAMFAVEVVYRANGLGQHVEEHANSLTGRIHIPGVIGFYIKDLS